MKLRNILIASFSLLLLVNTSCENFVTGVDEFDPTQPRDASLSQVMSSAEVGIIAFAEGDLARLAGIYTDQFTGVDRQYVSLNQYTTTAGDYDSQWDNIYTGAIKGLRIAQGKAAAVNNGRALGAAKILEAYVAGMTAAAFGDIPFSEAANFTEFPNPSYDTQTEVYQAAIALLDAGIADIQGAVAGTGYDGDFFGGSDAAWIQRANTIKAKFLMHQGQYAAALAAATLGINTAANDLRAPHGTSYGADFNIYYSFLVYDRPGYMSAADGLAPRLLDASATLSRGNAKTIEDARFGYCFITDQNYALGYEPNYYSLFDWGAPDGYFGTETSFDIVTYRENQLIIAEAELRTAGGFNASLIALNNYRAYLSGGGYINPDYIGGGNILYAPYVATDFDAGGMENADGVTPASALYREIVEERYVSLLGSLEVFNDARRRGFGDFATQQNWQVIGVTANVGTEIPQRFLIPQTELNSNASAPATPPGLFEKTAVFQ